MKTYLIGYDLNKSGQDYKELIDAIKEQASGWWHCLDSTWIIKSNLTAVELRDKLVTHIDANDELLVIKLSSEAAWRGFSNECSEWLKTHL